MDKEHPIARLWLHKKHQLQHVNNKSLISEERNNFKMQKQWTNMTSSEDHRILYISMVRTPVNSSWWRKRLNSCREHKRRWAEVRKCFSVDSTVGLRNYDLTSDDRELHMLQVGLRTWDLSKLWRFGKNFFDFIFLTSQNYFFWLSNYFLVDSIAIT